MRKDRKGGVRHVTDCEIDVYAFVKSYIDARFPGAFITGEYVHAPPSFPCVSIVVTDNAVYERAASLSRIENAANVTVTVDIYSNKTFGKKTECGALASYADAALALLGFQRLTLTPVQNLADATIYRLTGRYRALVT